MASSSSSFPAAATDSGEPIQTEISISWLESQTQLGESSLVDNSTEDPFSEDDFPVEYNNNKIKFSRVTIIQLANLVLIVIALCCSLVIHPLRKLSLFSLELWKWVLMALFLICGRMISGGLIRVLILVMEHNFIMRKRVLYFVYGLRSSVRNCVWLGLVLIGWLCIFRTGLKKTTIGEMLSLVTRLLICLFVGTLIWLAKTVVVKVLAMSFHVSTYFDKIQRSLFNHYVIRTLSGGPPLIGNMRDPSRKLTEKNISAWNMKMLIKIARKSVLSTLDEQLNESTGRDYSARQITCEKIGIVGARKIFYNVAKPGSEYIYKEDLLRFLREDEALKVLRWIVGENDESKGISKEALKIWVVNVFRERRHIALSLKDTKTALKKLHWILNVLVAGLVAIICLLILQVTTVAMIIAIFGEIFLMQFIFGDNLKKIYDAIVHLFIVNRYSVGDHVGIGGVQMIVEEIHLLTTKFIRLDNNTRVCYTNSIPPALAMDCINNSQIKEE